ncbi:hypothetical protein GLW03_19480 [Halobacillus halophilus]|uniref:hypothetical protein n=1 Tax=Halobacillus halophilus TaxID=1570 RepID=UPI00137D2CE1|nr:hypothetical protein [Halobacillus halophilus]MYL31979.1 hypothetical protein [Halobacillus halophilus]
MDYFIHTIRFFEFYLSQILSFSVASVRTAAFFVDFFERVLHPGGIRRRWKKRGGKDIVQYFHKRSVTFELKKLKLCKDMQRDVVCRRILLYNEHIILIEAYFGNT